MKGFLSGILLALAPSLYAGGLPELVFGQGVGVNIHFTSGHARDLDMMAEGGFKFVRMDFSWSATERSRGVYHWQDYDQLTANLEKRGMRAIYILDYSNPLYEQVVTTKNPITGQAIRDIASPQQPESVAAFARWAAVAAGHFKGRQIIWEIWNEPNITFWKPQPDVRQYTALALATSLAIRDVDPQATIVGPATSGIPLDFLGEFFASGILSKLDAVSVHPYRGYEKSPETVLPDYQKLRALIQAHAPETKKDMPILSGEWGYASHAKGVSLETQAAFAVRQQLINFISGVPLSIWYDWKNDGVDPNEGEHNFGTVTHDLQPKPAYKALRALAQELAGCRFAKRLAYGDTNDFLLLFSEPDGDRKLAAWTLGAPHEVTLYLSFSGNRVDARDAFGQAFDARIEQGKIVLKLTSLPVYVCLPKMAGAR